MAEQSPMQTFSGKKVYVVWYDGKDRWQKEGKLSKFDDDFIYLETLDNNRNPKIKITRAINRDYIRSITLREVSK